MRKNNNINDCPDFKVLQKYVNDELSMLEKDQLENHLDSCVGCHCEAIVEGLQLEAYSLKMLQAEPDLLRGFDAQKTNTMVKKHIESAKLFKKNTKPWQIAAVIVLLLGLGIFFYFIAQIDTSKNIKNISNQKKEIPEKNQEKNTEKEIKTEDKTPTESKKIKQKNLKDLPKENNQIAFAENTAFENQIARKVRSNNVSLKIILPRNDFITKNKITFKWQIEEYEGSLKLEILDNQNNLLHKADFAYPLNDEYELELKTWKEGLYYWRLVGKRDIFHVGKFKIINT